MNTRRKKLENVDFGPKNDPFTQPTLGIVTIVLNNLHHPLLPTFNESSSTISTKKLHEEIQKRSNLEKLNIWRKATYFGEKIKC